MIVIRPTSCLAAALVVLFTSASRAQSPDFAKEVLSILQAHCFKCHGDAGVKGKLSLFTRAGMLKGGVSGPAVSLEKPDDSQVLKAINHRDDLEMPPSGKLPQTEIDILTRWVKAGAAWPDSVVATMPASTGMKVTAQDRDYWAYRPVKKPTIPTVEEQEWVRNPIDAFILARLEAKKLTPAPPADRLALARRVYYNLIGLPPTPEEIDAFIGDKA